MRDFSYTKSPALLTNLHEIDELRKQILLSPLSPKSELQLQWNALLDHIHYSLELNGISIPQDHILRLLSPEGTRKQNETERYVVKHKDAMDYLYHNWLVNDEPIKTDHILTLYRAAFEGKLNVQDLEIERTLQYIQVNPENAVIQASLAQFLILDLYPFSENNEAFSHLLFLMFLYKNSYDFRRLLVIEEFFFSDLIHYKDLLNKLSKQTNLTEWLEYVTRGMVMQLQKIVKIISSEKRTSVNYEPIFELNDRQKKILSLLNQPGLKINNKMIQKLYKVSQITASRDLSKLTSLGLVIAIGGGRSTYYTKV